MSREDQQKGSVKVMSDRWSNIHKRKLQEVGRVKPEAMDEFYAWVKSAPI